MVQVNVDDTSKCMMSQSLNLLLKSIDSADIEQYPLLVYNSLAFYRNHVEALLRSISENTGNDFVFMDSDVLLLQDALINYDGSKPAKELAGMLNQLNDLSNSQIQ